MRNESTINGIFVTIHDDDGDDDDEKKSKILEHHMEPTFIWSQKLTENQLEI